MNRLFLFAIILLSSCTSLNKVESTSEKNIKNNEYTYSDPDSKIRYNVSNDDKNLHICLNTADLSTTYKIIRTGLKICFDVKGKKGKKVFFEYPIPQDQMVQGQMRTRPAAGDARGSGLKRMVDQISNEAEFDNNGEKESILVISKESDIKAAIREINNNEIIYDLFIPLKRISKDGIAALSNLSVGIISGEQESSSTDRVQSRGSMGGGRGGMGGGGGRSGGGRGGMGGGGGRSGGAMGAEGQSGIMDRSSMSKPIEFWFKLDLQK